MCAEPRGAGPRVGLTRRAAINRANSNRNGIKPDEYIDLDDLSAVKRLFWIQCHDFSSFVLIILAFKPLTKTLTYFVNP